MARKYSGMKILILQLFFYVEIHRLCDKLLVGGTARNIITLIDLSQIDRLLRISQPREGSCDVGLDSWLKIYKWLIVSRLRPTSPRLRPASPRLRPASPITHPKFHSTEDPWLPFRDSARFLAVCLAKFLFASRLLFLSALAANWDFKCHKVGLGSILTNRKLFSEIWVVISMSSTANR